MNVFLNEALLRSLDDWIPSSKEEALANFLDLTESLLVTKFNRHCQVHYSAKGIDRVFQNLEILQVELEHELTNPIQRLRMVLSELAAYNWDMNPKQSKALNYYLLVEEATNLCVNNSTIAEAAHYGYNQEAVLLLCMQSSEFSSDQVVTVLISSTDKSAAKELIKVETRSSEKLTRDWLTTRTSKRNFNLNPKHGENGKGAQNHRDEEVSVLRCSKEKAQHLLDSAIGYPNTNNLYNYDVEHRGYIVFKFEGNSPQNSYHGYHTNGPSEVPEEVRRYLQRIIDAQ
jgi:hypothetical protein